MRGIRRWLASCFFMVAGCAEYNGDTYEQVVEAREVELFDQLPAGYDIIGVVFTDVTHTVDGPLQYLLYCHIDERLQRRMKREAAENGGEILVGFECEFDSVEVEDGTECTTHCWADVGRLVARDD